MKKLFTLMGVFAFTICSYGFNKRDYYGTWLNENTRITINEDTITIDDIGLEGFSYTYKYDGNTNTFYLYDSIYNNIELVMRIPLLNENEERLNVILSDVHKCISNGFWVNKK